MTGLLNLITTYSLLYGVDPRMVMSIVQLESRFNTFAVGQHGELGLMQLRPEYFSKSCQKNFQPNVKTPESVKIKKIPCGQELFLAEENLKIGIQNLKKVMQSCAHKKDGTWVLCHNLGVKGASRIKHPKEFAYYKEVMRNYQAFKNRDQALLAMQD